MKNFIGKLLIVAFTCMALLIALKYKEIKKELMEGKIYVFTSNR